MKIELRNIKYAAFASEETSCFRATLYVDGVKSGEVSNDGHGGCDNFSDRDVEAKLNAYGKTLPKKISDIIGDKRFEYEQDAESLVGDLLSDWLVRRDLTRALKSKVLFTKAGTPGIFQTRKLDKNHMALLLSNPAKHLPQAAVILNSLPEDQALALYRSAS